MKRNKLRVVVLGAGFGGLELTASLSEKLGENLDLILIDQNDSFFFGYSKLDVMFGRRSPQSVRHPYSQIKKTGVTFLQEKIIELDPEKRLVTTENRTCEADVLVVALGADYDIPATPGLAEGGYEFYTFEGAERISRMLPSIEKGHLLIGVTGFPFKCPQAPSEVALLLHDYLVHRDVRNNCKISLVVPFELPIPPSYGASKELLEKFRKKGIGYIPEMMVGAIDPGRKVAELDDGQEIPFDIFLGIPEHCVPAVVGQSGLVHNEWVPVNRNNLKTKFPNVYAIGDITSVGTPKAGMFARGAARVAADSIVSEFSGIEFTGGYTGNGNCYVEVGDGEVGRVDVDFFSGPVPRGVHQKATTALAEEKLQLEMSWRTRWFGPEG